jgi:uncharacterized phage protein (TIGR01671 family)
MREILFRGKILYNGQWVEGHLVVCNTNGRSFITELIEVDEDSWVYWEVDPNTIGQYTGMKDKNDVKIFEGDIVRRHEEPFNLTDVGVVVYNKAIGSFRLHVENNGTIKRYDFVASDIYNDGYCHVECKATFEVIGNKFDNQKFLEGGKQ